MHTPIITSRNSITTFNEIEIELDNLINQNVCVKWSGVRKQIIKKYRFEY